MATREAVQRTVTLIVSPGYFRTMRIPLVAGRLLAEADTRENPLSVVINQTAAARYWPHQNPIEAYGRFSRPDGDRFQIVGIVGDVRQDGLGKPVDSEIYLLHSIAPANPLGFVVRSPLPADQLVPAIRRAVRSVDPALAVYDAAPMRDIVADSIRLERLGSLMTAFFAGAALLMATLGIYGLVAYTVRQRRVEIGTRMALGALRRDVVGLVVGGGLKIAACGVAGGGAAVTVIVRLLGRYIQIGERGWTPFAFAVIVVAVVSTAASSFPAWRASRLSPLAAIRDERA